MEEKDFAKGITAQLIINIFALIASVLSGVAYIKSYVEEITLGQTTIIASIIASDLRTRLNLYESYVEELESEGKPVPTLLLYNIKALEDHIKDVKNWEIHHD